MGRPRAGTDPSLTFEGKPCRVCGGTLRYLCNTACVACQIAHSRRHKYRGDRPPTQGHEVRLRSMFARLVWGVVNEDSCT